MTFLAFSSPSSLLKISLYFGPLQPELARLKMKAFFTGSILGFFSLLYIWRQTEGPAYLELDYIRLFTSLGSRKPNKRAEAKQVSVGSKSPKYRAWNLKSLNIEPGLKKAEQESLGFESPNIKLRPKMPQI